MENKIQVFENSEFGSVRTIEEDGKVLFCGFDVAKALGYSNPRDALSRHCKDVVKRDALDSTGRVQAMSFIPESDLYRLAFGSKLSSAGRVQNWLTDEILSATKSQQKPHEIVSNSGIQTFKNAEFGEMRMLEENGEILFCALDVASALGYSNTRNAIAMHCDDVLKRDAWVQTGVTASGAPAMRKTEMSFIPESDFYKLAFGSKLPSAKRFTNWVTKDVLPTIRKHGAYLTPATLEAALDDPDYLLQLTLRYKVERDKRKALEAKVEEDRPKLDYYNAILRCKEAVPITVIAKDYGMSACAMNKKLNELGIQYKTGGTWCLYQKYADQGYTKTDTYCYRDSVGGDHANVHTKWTQKGRLFLYDALKTAGVLPRMEQEGDKDAVA